MANYDYDEELIHSLLGKIFDKHKYVARVETKNSTPQKPKYRYFYDRDEYDSFLGGAKKALDKVGSAAKKVGSAAKKVGAAMAKSAGKITSKAKAIAIKRAKMALSNGRVAADKALEKIRNIDMADLMHEASMQIKYKTSIGKHIAGIICNKAKKTANKLNPNAVEISADVRVVPGKGVGAGGRKYIAKLQYPDGKIRYIYSKKQWEGVKKQLKQYQNEPSFMHSVKRLAINEDGSFESGDKRMASSNGEGRKFDNAGNSLTFRNVNCQYCTIAADLRRRGYDVESVNVASNHGQRNLGEFYEGLSVKTEPKLVSYRDSSGKVVTTDRATGYKNNNNVASVMVFSGVDQSAGEDASGAKMMSNIKAQTARFPNGSSGNLSIRWKDGGGHSISWEKTETGQIVYRDNQCNEIWDESKVRYCLSVSDPNQSLTFTRLDNLTPKEKVLDYVQSR